MGLIDDASEVKRGEGTYVVGASSLVNLARAAMQLHELKRSTVTL